MMGASDAPGERERPGGRAYCVAMSTAVAIYAGWSGPAHLVLLAQLKPRAHSPTMPTNYVAIASLVVSVAGAVLLARGLAFQTPRHYAAEQPGALYPRTTNIPGDAARASDVADAQAGAGLLVVGFAAQVVAALRSDWASWEAIVAAATAALIILLAISQRGHLRRRFERELYLTRVDREARVWTNGAADKSRAAFQAQYRAYFGAADRAEEFDGWVRLAAQHLGVNPAEWEAV